MKDLFPKLILVLAVFVLLHFLYPLELLAAIADNFNKVAIGVAALATAYFGSTWFIEEHLRQRQIDLYRKNYPPAQYGETWKIVVREDRDGEPHVLDIKNSVIHHIWNMKTIYDMGWQFYDRDPVKKVEFSKYQIGEKIRTRGELGE
jgi:hypothetical protein